MDNFQKMKKLQKMISEIEMYERSIQKLHFDLDTICPKNGTTQAGKDIANLSQLPFKIKNSSTFKNLVIDLHNNSEGLTFNQQKLISLLYEDYEKTKNITGKLNLEATKAYINANNNWLRAKEKSDFSLFKEDLKKVVYYQKKFITIRDHYQSNIYDEILNDAEKGINTKILDNFFNELKKGIIPLLEKITKSKKEIRTDFLNRSVPIHKQEKFSLYLLELIGLNKDSLVLMTTEHPFTTNFGKDDVRVTTHYFENLFISNIFSTIHEGGHAMFMQNEPLEYFQDHISDNMTSGMHEAISRLYENVIGRSRAFIHLIYPKFMEMFQEEFSDVTEEQLYEAVNIVSPSLIRTEADEVTYSLHIVIRYELEKAIINDNINIDDLEKLWNKLYKKYLNVDVLTASEGILQDVHWSGGMGYFPAYALGNVYASQIYKQMEKSFDVEACILNNDLGKIREWLKENVFKHASILTPSEWIRKISNEDINCQYYIEYLNKKFNDIY